MKFDLPRHVAIIMDGNGRWAKRRGLTRVEGHRQGVQAARKIVNAAREIGIPVLTLYTFSKENWNRPQQEVQALMGLLEHYLEEVHKEIEEHDIRVQAIGEMEDLPAPVQQSLRRLIDRTRSKKGMLVNLALSYGGRAEIVRAASRLLEDFKQNRISPKEITPDLFSSYLYTQGLPDPDLLIRTGGDFRISNFLLWQMAYTEIVVTQVLWPDFRKRHFIRCLLDYQKRERRFGGVQEEA
ncbi:MAG: isoprenyl transferase [Deltaproteobacteria bacterium]|nr:isoprenyl transferase [Deltaproteobacteria bacterium]